MRLSTSQATLGTRGFFSRATRSFVGHRPTNRKPRMKSLWNPSLPRRKNGCEGDYISTNITTNISTPINSNKRNKQRNRNSSSFLRPIWNAWQNPVNRAPFTMPVDNKRIAGPEITQPVVLREGKRLRKPLVTSIVFFV